MMNDKSFTMRVLLGLILVLNFASVSARATAKVVEQNIGTNTTLLSDWTEWIRALLPSREEVEEGLEAQWKNLEEDMTHQKSKLTQHLEEVNRNAQETMNEIEQNMDNRKKQIKKRIEADIFKQKQGWERFRKSARAQTGIVIGGAMTFAGCTSALSRTSLRVQAAQISWVVLHKYNITKGIHDPWVQDAAAGVLAMSLVAKKSRENNAVLQRIIPILTISLAIVESVGMILDKFEGDVSVGARVAAEAITAVLSTAALSLLPVPLSVVATSIAGASLLFQSIVVEVISNWFWILEHGAQSLEGMDREKRRKIEKDIRTTVYHIMEKKLLYPVCGAFEEIHAALHNQTLTEPSLQSKVQKAINDSHKVKLVWSFATAGVVVQMLWRAKPVERAFFYVRRWWVDLRTDKPKPIKKRRVG